MFNETGKKAKGIGMAKPVIGAGILSRGTSGGMAPAKPMSPNRLNSPKPKGIAAGTLAGSALAKKPKLKKKIIMANPKLAGSSSKPLPIKSDMDETKKLQGSIDKGMNRALKNFRR